MFSGKSFRVRDLFDTWNSCARWLYNDVIYLKTKDKDLSLTCLGKRRPKPQFPHLEESVSNDTYGNRLSKLTDGSEGIDINGAMNKMTK